MRLPIINKLSSRVEVNTLFLQPTPWCARNCKGCYVKERNVGGAQRYKKEVITPVADQFKLIKLFCEGKLALANEITVAMDDLPTHRGQQYHMVHLYDLIMGYIRESQDQNRPLPRMHMTFHTMNTYLSYVDRTKRNSDWYRRSVLFEDTWETLALPGHLLDMINFSQLTPNPITKNMLSVIRNKTPVNYNYLIPRNLNQGNIAKHVAHLAEIAEHVDHIYLVIYKNPIGKERNSKEILEAQKNMANDRFYLHALNDNLPEHLRKKIHIDGCLKDIFKFKFTGYGCPSNVSRFQVWPDGAVSGCAYADKSICTTIGRSAGQVLQNIREARKKYDFTDAPCHLRDDLDNSNQLLNDLKSTRVGKITKEILKDIL
tara:strand:+ start:1184 stop:2302 length:1119 start_codon:yes stop_codon:yes gene_type:complete